MALMFLTHHSPNDDPYTQDRPNERKAFVEKYRKYISESHVQGLISPRATKAKAKSLCLCELICLPRFVSVPIKRPIQRSHKVELSKNQTHPNDWSFELDPTPVKFLFPANRENHRDRRHDKQSFSMFSSDFYLLFGPRHIRPRSARFPKLYNESGN